MTQQPERWYKTVKTVCGKALLPAHSFFMGKIANGESVGVFMRSTVKRQSGQADVCVMAGTAAHTVFVVLFMTEIHAKTRRNGGKTIKIYEYTYMEKIYNIFK